MIFLFISVEAATAGDSLWSYFSGGEPPQGWRGHDFNDSAWQRRPAGWKFPENFPPSIPHNDSGDDMKMYARRKFFIQNPRRVTSMILAVTCPGPFIAYVNGIEVIRNRSGSAAGRPAEELDISGFAHELLSGMNIISVQCDSRSENSAFNPELNIEEK